MRDDSALGGCVNSTTCPVLPMQHWLMDDLFLKQGRCHPIHLSKVIIGTIGTYWGSQAWETTLRKECHSIIWTPIKRMTPSIPMTVVPFWLLSSDHLACCQGTHCLRDSVSAECLLLVQPAQTVIRLPVHLSKPSPTLYRHSSHVPCFLYLVASKFSSHSIILSWRPVGLIIWPHSKHLSQLPPSPWYRQISIKLLKLEWRLYVSF